MQLISYLIQEDLFNSRFALILATSGGEKAGPLVEFERRIASGELIEGDHFQVKFILVGVGVVWK